MKYNWFYLLIALMFLLMLFISMRYFRGTGHAAIGVTFSNEYKISADKAAIVKSILVVPGQQIKEGQLLIELSSADLEIEIQKLEQKITTFRSDQQERKKLAQSKIALIQAENGVKIEELNTDISEAEGDLSLNRQITRDQQLKRDSTADSPLSSRIKSLKLQRERYEEAARIRAQDIQQQDATEQQILDNQIVLLERELQLLQEQKRQLSKYAAAPGVVGNVYVKPGEQIEAFTPLISLNPIHPSTVVAYLVGRKETPAIGSSVTISAYERPSNAVSGKIIGYGAVVELPQILQKSTAVKAFGREVFIEIGSNNNLASGEKVLIR